MRQSDLKTPLSLDKPDHSLYKTHLIVQVYLRKTCHSATEFQKFSKNKETF